MPWLVVALSVGIGLAIVRPFVDAPVGFDTQATVLYFDRVAAGTRLETALSTTPKPFLTLVYGVLHALTGDWRPLVWATILAHATAAGLATVLATRAVGLAAGLAAGLAVAGMPLLIEDAAFGNAVPWALAGWFGAGIALSGPRPRPIVAGSLLGLAALCRLESLVIVATAGFAFAWVRVGPWPLHGQRPAVPARLWPAVAIPFLALPVMLVHDWLLTGDPLFWIEVSERYSDAVRDSRTVLGPIERVTWFVRRYLGLWPAVALAAAGLVVLVRGRRWPELVGLAGMGAGIGAFLVVLAARGLYAPDRYAIPVDVALLLLAAVGFGRLATLAADRIGRAAGVRAAVVGVAFALALGSVAAVRAGPFDPELGRVVGDLRTLNENAARVVPILQESADRRPAGTGFAWYVPAAVRPRLAVDLGRPLSEVGTLSLALLDPAGDAFRPGQRVYHDLHGDIPRGGYAVLETGDEVRLGEVVLRPVLDDAPRGIWLFDVIAP